MDDLIITCDSNANVDYVKLLLKQKVEMKDLEELCYFLSIQSLIYMTITKPNLSYAIGLVSQFL